MLHVASEKCLFKKKPSSTQRTQPKQCYFSELLLCPTLSFEIMSYFMALAARSFHSHTEAAAADLWSGNTAVGNILMLYFLSETEVKKEISASELASGS